MHHITLIGLFLALNDLLTKRLAALQAFGAGGGAVKRLTAQRDALAALPAVIAGRPLVDELDAADERHDGLGYAFWYIVEAYLVHPDTPPALLKAAQTIRAAFLPTLADLVASYPAEAKAAMARKPDLANLKAELQMIPVAMAGPTLYEWVAAFLAAGEVIDTLLSARADLDARSRKAATTLRAEVIGTINRLRKDLAVELKQDSALPADLDAQIFSYFDLQEKEAADAAAQAKAAKTKAAAPPAPPPPPAG